MPVVKRIVCLANSRKFSGRCVAGKERTPTGSGAWIRPVSNRPAEEVSERERQYRDGSDPKVLDVIDIPLLNPHPKSYQSENWLLDPGRYWERVARATRADLEALRDEPNMLWTNESSTYHGVHDRVAVDQADRLGGSLFLLHLENVRLHVFAPGSDFGDHKRRVQASFQWHAAFYRLWVTDPVVERRYLAGADGDYPVGECFATVSLGEPHQGFCYKLVAAIIGPPRESG